MMCHQDCLKWSKLKRHIQEQSNRALKVKVWIKHSVYHVTFWILGLGYHVVTYSGVEASIFELAGARTSHNWFHTAAHISQPTQLVCLVDKG